MHALLQWVPAPSFRLAKHYESSNVIDDIVQQLALNCWFVSIGIDAAVGYRNLGFRAASRIIAQ